MTTVGEAVLSVVLDTTGVVSGLQDLHQTAEQTLSDLEKRAQESAQNFADAFNEGVAGSSEAVANLANTMGTAIGTMMDPVNLAIVGFGMLSAGIAQSIEAAASFEEQMSGVAAVSSATADELEQLTNLALDQGAATSFSANEAAEGIEELSKAGVATADIIGGGLQGALSLAASSGMSDLGFAAEIASNALNTFSLSGEQVSMVADVVSNAANKSALDVGDWNEALSAAGSVVSTMNQPIEEFTAVMAMMANNAVKGSDAGTSFKTMLQQLQGPSKEAAGLMKEMGIHVYDAQGTMKKFPDIIRNLEASFEGLTEQQRDQNAITLFGADGIRAFNILMKEGSESLGLMTETMITEGAAATSATTRLDNLIGAKEQLNGITNKISLSIGKLFLPVALEMTAWTTQIYEQVIKVVDAIAFFNTVLMKTLQPVRDFIAQNQAASLVVNSLKVAITAVAGTLGLIMLRQGLIALAGVIRGTVIPAITAQIAVLGPLLIPLASVAAAVTALYIAYKTNFGGIKDIVDNVMAKVKEQLSYFPIYFRTVIDVTKAFVGGLGGILSGLGSIFRGVGILLYAVLVEPWVKMFKSMAAGPQKAVEDSAKHLSGFGEWISKFLGKVSQFIKPFIDLVSKLAPTVTNGIEELIRKAVTSTGSFIEKLLPQTTEGMDELDKSLKSAQIERDKLLNTKGSSLAAQGLAELRVGALQVRDSYVDARRALTDAVISGQTSIAVEQSKGMYGKGGTSGQSISNVPEAPSAGTKKQAQEAVVDYKKLVDEAIKLQTTLNTALKSGNKEAILAANEALNKFRVKSKDHQRALTEANQIIRAQEALDKAAVAAQTKAQREAEAAARKAKAALKEAQRAREKSIKKQKSELAELEATKRQFTQALIKLNTEIKRGIEDGDVTQSKATGWSRKYEDLATSAKNAGINLSQVAGAEATLTKTLIAQGRAQATVNELTKKANKLSESKAEILKNLGRLNEDMARAVQDGNVNEGNLVSWGRKYEDLTEKARDAGFILSAVAGAETTRFKTLTAQATAQAQNNAQLEQQHKNNRVIIADIKEYTNADLKHMKVLAEKNNNKELYDAIDKEQATRAAKDLKDRNAQTLAFAKDADDIRLDQLRKQAIDTKNEELRLGIEKIQRDRKVSLEKKAAEAIAKAQEMVQAAQEGANDAIADQIKEMERLIEKGPEAADKLKQYVEQLKALAQFNKDVKRKDTLFKNSESLIDKSKDERVDLQSTIDDKPKQTGADKLIEDIGAQILAEKAWQDELNKRIALNNVFKQQYQDQLRMSQENVAGLTAERNALVDLNVKAKEAVRLREIEADSQKLLDQASQMMQERNRGELDQYEELANALDIQATKDASRAESLRSLAAALRVVSQEERDLKRAKEEAKETDDLLMEAANTYAEAVRGEESSLDKLIRKLESKIGSDETTNAILRDQIALLKEAKDIIKEREEAERLAEKTKSLLSDAEQTLREALAGETSELEKKAAALEAQALLDKDHSDELIRQAAALRNLDTYLQAYNKTLDTQKRTEELLLDAQQERATADGGKELTSLEVKALALDKQAEAERKQVEALQTAIYAGAANAATLKEQIKQGKDRVTQLGEEAAALRKLSDAQKVKDEQDKKNKDYEDFKKRALTALSDAEGERKNSLLEMAEQARQMAAADLENADALSIYAQKLEEAGQNMEKLKKAKDTYAQIKDLGGAIGKIGDALTGNDKWSANIEGAFKAFDLVKGITQDIASGNYVGAVIKLVGAIADAIAGFAKAQAQAKKLREDFNEQFTFVNGDDFAKTTIQSRGFFADLFGGGPEVVQEIDKLGTKFAKTMEDAFKNGISGGMKAALQSNNINLFKDGLRKSVYDAMVQGVIDIFINDTLLKNIVGPAVTAWAKAMTTPNRNDDAAAAAGISAALSQVDVLGEKFFADFGPMLQSYGNKWQVDDEPGQKADLFGNAPTTQLGQARIDVTLSADTFKPMIDSLQSIDSTLIKMRDMLSSGMVVSKPDMVAPPSVQVVIPKETFQPIADLAAKIPEFAAGSADLRATSVELRGVAEQFRQSMRNTSAPRLSGNGGLI